MQRLFAVLVVLSIGVVGDAAAGGRRGSGGGSSRVRTAPSGTGSSSKSVSVRGYTKKNGSYVAPARRTSADSTQRNNYTTKGNTNTYTGKNGSRDAKR
jgi:hypothetical protein